MIVAHEFKAGVVPFEVKDLDESARTFEGMAAAWDLDLGGDLIHRGAFKKTLGGWKKSKRPLPLIDQHNYTSIRSVVGKLLEAEETDVGLDARFQLIDGPDGDEVMRRVKGGFVDGLSIGYRPIAMREPTDDERKSGIRRHLTEVKLEEISVVIWPMNTSARIDLESVKALLRDGDLTDEQRHELAALLPEPDRPHRKAADVLPDDPARLALEARLRVLKLRTLGVV